MPRPTGGYTNKAGDAIPGTSDITKRFADKSALLYWAFNQGKLGLNKLYDNVALDIGTAVHMMAELDLKGQPDDDIEFYITTTLRDPDHLDKARAAFKAFRQWRTKFHVEPHAQEVSLISEKLQFGGTLDTVAHIRNGLGLLDFKTSKDGTVYPEHVWQLAAYGLLWEENRPNEVLSQGYHLIMLPKDGSKPIHREFSRADLEPFREQFKLFRKAWDLDTHCTNSKVLKGIEVAPSIAPERPVNLGKKLRKEIQAIDDELHAADREGRPARTMSYRDMSLAEIMRANRLLKEDERVPA